MGLIKKNRLVEQGGTIIIEKPPLEIRRMKKTGIQAQSNPDMASAHIPAKDENEARNESERIIDQAYEAAEQVKQAAKEEGLSAGKEEASAKIREALSTLNEAVKVRKEIIGDAEAEILRLSLKVAEQIIRSEVSLHRDVCLNIVAEAIGRVSDREQIIIKVNREDAEYLKRYKDRLAGMLDGVKSFSIIEDSNIEAGGCIIETNLGFIDARIPTKLRSIEAALTKTSAEEKA